jgi:hypothetical protein
LSKSSIDCSLHPTSALSGDWCSRNLHQEDGRKKQKLNQIESQKNGDPQSRRKRRSNFLVSHMPICLLLLTPDAKNAERSHQTWHSRDFRNAIRFYHKVQRKRKEVFMRIHDL